MALLAMLLVALAGAQTIEAAPLVTIDTDLAPEALATLQPSPMAMLTAIVARLHADVPIHVKLIAAVGWAEPGSIIIADHGLQTIGIQVDGPPAQTGAALAHVLTHAVHEAMGGATTGSGRNVGAAVIGEGLAMRVARGLFPAAPETDVTETRPGWMVTGDAKRNAILRDIRVALNDSDAETVSRFTAGTGPAGLEREAYYVGWQVTGYWLAHGETLGEIAHVKERDAPARVAEAIDKMLMEPAR